MSGSIVGALAALALAGCVTTLGTSEQGTRDQSVAMSSMVGVDPARLSGRWFEVEAFVPDGASCVIGGVTFSQQSNGDFTLTEGPCGDGAPRSGLARRSGPGRYVFDGEELWLLWVSQNSDVAVIATQSGRAHILSRRLDIAGDKRQAARDILSWNGFDVSQLQPARRK